MYKDYVGCYPVMVRSCYSVGGSANTKMKMSVSADRRELATMEQYVSKHIALSDLSTGQTVHPWM